MNAMTLVLESDVFPESHAALRAAVRDAGHHLLDWDDAWWRDNAASRINQSRTIFHGSLGNAARIDQELKWSPGSFCDPSAFSCSAWYDDASEWLLHAEWRFLSAKEFVASAPDIAHSLGDSSRIFVRPDSPLKPFSGRVVDTSSVTLASLDHGFYYDDEMLPIVACPVCHVGREWRFVIVGSTVVAGSAYDASTRSAIADTPNSGAWTFAQRAATAISDPADTYVLDVCESNGDLRMIELNPFGGADLYACDAMAIVEAVSALA